MKNGQWLEIILDSPHNVSALIMMMWFEHTCTGNFIPVTFFFFFSFGLDDFARM
jgi:hypothetical protein